MFTLQETQSLLQDEGDERQVALQYIADAWNTAEADGVDSEALSHAALFASLATLVKMYGEDATAKMVTELPKLLEMGEYTLDRTIQ